MSTKCIFLDTKPHIRYGLFYSIFHFSMEMVGFSVWKPGGVFVSFCILRNITQRYHYTIMFWKMPLVFSGKDQCRVTDEMAVVGEGLAPPSMPPSPREVDLPSGKDGGSHPDGLCQTTTPSVSCADSSLKEGAFPCPRGFLVSSGGQSRPPLRYRII